MSKAPNSLKSAILKSLSSPSPKWKFLLGRLRKMEEKTISRDIPFYETAFVTTASKVANDPMRAIFLVELSLSLPKLSPKMQSAFYLAIQNIENQGEKSLILGLKAIKLHSKPRDRAKMAYELVAAHSNLSLPPWKAMKVLGALIIINSQKTSEKSESFAFLAQSASEVIEKWFLSAAKDKALSQRQRIQLLKIAASCRRSFNQNSLQICSALFLDGFEEIQEASSRMNPLDLLDLLEATISLKEFAPPFLRNQVIAWIIPKMVHMNNFALLFFAELVMPSFSFSNEEEFVLLSTYKGLIKAAPQKSKQNQLRRLHFLLDLLVFIDKNLASSEITLEAFFKELLHNEAFNPKVLGLFIAKLSQTESKNGHFAPKTISASLSKAITRLLPHVCPLRLAIFYYRVNFALLFEQNLRKMIANYVIRIQAKKPTKEIESHRRRLGLNLLLMFSNPSEALNQLCFIVSDVPPETPELTEALELAFKIVFSHEQNARLQMDAQDLLRNCLIDHVELESKCAVFLVALYWHLSNEKAKDELKGYLKKKFQDSFGAEHSQEILLVTRLSKDQTLKELIWRNGKEVDSQVETPQK